MFIKNICQILKPSITYLFKSQFVFRVRGLEFRKNSLDKTILGPNIIEFYQDAPCYMNAHYAVSVWGNSPAEESLLLGLVVKTLLEHTIMTGAELKGDSFYPDDKVNVFPNLQADHNDLMSFWRALNEEIRPALFYYAKFRIESDRRSSEIRRVVGKDIAVNR